MPQTAATPLHQGRGCVCGQQEQAQWSGTTQVRDNVMGYVSLNVDRQVTCDVGT